VGILYLWIFPREVYEFWPHFLLLSFYLFVFLSVVITLISYWERNKKSLHISTLDSVNLPGVTSKIKILWAILILVMISLYVFFNGHTN